MSDDSALILSALQRLRGGKSGHVKHKAGRAIPDPGGRDPAAANQIAFAERVPQPFESGENKGAVVTHCAQIGGLARVATVFPGGAFL